jgi:hypothetical protein
MDTDLFYFDLMVSGKNGGQKCSQNSEPYLALTRRILKHFFSTYREGRGEEVSLQNFSLSSVNSGWMNEGRAEMTSAYGGHSAGSRKECHSESQTHRHDPALVCTGAAGLSADSAVLRKCLEGLSGHCSSSQTGGSPHQLSPGAVKCHTVVGPVQDSPPLVAVHWLVQSSRYKGDDHGCCSQVFTSV